MIPGLTAVFGTVLGMVVGIACLRALIASGYRLDLLLLAALSFAIVGMYLRRAFRVVKEIRALVMDADH